jgi:hypothetical protein
MLRSGLWHLVQQGVTTQSPSADRSFIICLLSSSLSLSLSRFEFLGKMAWNGQQKNSAYCLSIRSRDSSDIATGYGLYDRGIAVPVPVGSKTFNSPYRADWLCGPHSLLYSGYQGLFRRLQSGPGLKLITSLQLVSRSRKPGSLYALFHTLSWRSAKLTKHRNNFNFTVPFSIHM